MTSNGESGILPLPLLRPLLFPPNSLKRIGISLLIHETPRFGAPLGPRLVLRVENLRVPAHRTYASVVTDRFVLHHRNSFKLWQHRQGLS